MKNDIIIIGGGEHSRVIVNAIVLDKFKWNYLGYLDTKNDNNDSVGCCFGTDEDISRVVEKYSNVKLIFGIGNISIRSKVYQKYLKFADFFATVIHPAAIVAEETKIEKGVYIGAGAIIQPGAKIEQHSIINTGAIIEHDCCVGEFSHIAPGAVLGGCCSIGKNTFIGLGSRIKDHINIGKNVTIGAGAVVINDIQNGVTAVGVPAGRK